MIPDIPAEGRAEAGQIESAIAASSTPARVSLRLGGEQAAALVREEELRRAIELIRSSVDVEITGSWGGGVSDFMGALRRRLERHGFSTVVVAARPGFSSMNFAALRFSLPEVFQSTNEPAVIVDRLSRLLAAGEPAVVVLENADHLDPFSLQAITESLRRSRASLLASLSSMSAQPPRLLLDRPLLRESLRPLSYIDVEDLLRARSASPIDPMLVRRIYLDSGGNAQMATALFDVGVRTGRIGAPEGIWALEGDGLWDRSLAAPLEQSLSHLGAAARACLRQAALAPTDRATLADAHGTDALEELVLEGLLHVDDGQPAFVSPPIVVSYLRSRAPVDGDRHPGSPDPMSDPAWRQRLAQQLDAASDALLAKARERYASQPDADAAVDLVRALWSAGRSYGEAAELFDVAVAGADGSASGFILLLLQARWLAFGLGRVDQALEVLSRAEESGRSYAADARAHRILIDAWAHGVPDDVVEWARDLANDSDGGLLEVTWVSVASLLAQAGWPLTALKILGEEYPADHEAASLWFFTRVSALLATDSYDVGAALAERHVYEALRTLDRGRLFAASYGLIQARLYLGQWERTRELAENIQTAGRPNLLLLPLQRMARSIQAVVAAERGRVGAPDSGSMSEGATAAPFAVAQPGMREMIEHVAAERYDRLAPFVMVSARATHAAGGHFTATYLCAWALALDPSESTLADVSKLGSTSELTAFANFLAYMRILIERPADVISGTATMPVRGTYSYLAIVGTVRKAKSMGGPEREALMREALSMSRRLSVAFPQKIADAPDSETEPLSARERQIARLAGRLSNAQIAERLGISKRTVDHHVSNALKKTGVASRHELAARMGAA